MATHFFPQLKMKKKKKCFILSQTWELTFLISHLSYYCAEAASADRQRKIKPPLLPSSHQLAPAGCLPL